MLAERFPLALIFCYSALTFRVGTLRGDRAPKLLQLRVGVEVPWPAPQALCHLHALHRTPYTADFTPSGRSVCSKRHG